MKIITGDEFTKRRHQILETMDENTIAFFSSATEKTRNGSAEYPYRQDSNFLYLTGFNEPEAILVLLKDSEKMESRLFCRPKDRKMEIWSGQRLGPEKAVSHLGMDKAFSIDSFEDELPGLLDGRQKLFYIFEDEKLARKLRDCTAKLKQRERFGALAPCVFADIEPVLHDMRTIKSKVEITVMEAACKVTAGAHRRAMAACRPGMYEYELEAEIQHEFLRNGARFPAYNSIIASGERACTLHYCENNRRIDEGELVLIDAGCELSGYAADITRTFPANGKFSPEQQSIYELVLKAQEVAIELIKPGVSWNEPQDAIIHILTEGLLSLGILSGQLEKLLADQAVRDFYMHGFGHFLGLDVHDAGSIKKGETWNTLKSGMVLTVEPGLYIDAFHEQVDAKWRGIGVRIEDNVLVTDNGCRLLSEGLPRTVTEIETLMSAEKG